MTALVLDLGSWTWSRRTALAPRSEPLTAHPVAAWTGTATLSAHAGRAAPASELAATAAHPGDALPRQRLLVRCEDRDRVAAIRL